MMEIVKSVVRKYAALMPPVVLLLVSGVIFLLVLLLNGRLNAEIAKRIKAASEVRSLISQAPSKNQPDQEEIYQKKHDDDAKAVETLADLTSQRELICYNPVILPQPKEKTSQVYLEFGKEYRRAIEGLLSGISAMDAPSEQEIRSKIGNAALRPDAGFALQPGAGASQNAMVDALCLSRAEKIPVYANPGLFSWYSFWENYQFSGTEDQAIGNVWYSQIAYWIYDDIIATIRAMNTGSTKISSSSVKRLLGVSFNGPVQVQTAASPYYNPTPGYAAAGAATNPDFPAYVQTNSIFVAAPLTGRVCNDQIDVVHFAVSVVLDSRAVLGFMRELCSAKQHTYRENFAENSPAKNALHNQITILQNDIEPVLRETDAVHAYYRYGSAPVVRLNLVCEYLFYRNGYDAVKPDLIKKQLSPTPTDSTGIGQQGMYNQPAGF